MRVLIIADHPDIASALALPSLRRTGRSSGLRFRFTCQTTRRATRRSNPECRRRKDSGLLRGACHRAALCADPLARNDNVGARLRIPAACSARVVQAVAPGKRPRAQGKPGAPNAPAASRANEGSTRVSTLQVRRNSGLPCATVYDLLRALPGVHDLRVTVARRSSSARLAPAQGCQDHTPSPSARCCSSAQELTRSTPRRPLHPATHVS